MYFSVSFMTGDQSRNTVALAFLIIILYNLIVYDQNNI